MIFNVNINRMSLLGILGPIILLKSSLNLCKFTILDFTQVS